MQNIEGIPTVFGTTWPYNPITILPAKGKSTKEWKDVKFANYLGQEKKIMSANVAGHAQILQYSNIVGRTQ